MVNYPPKFCPYCGDELGRTTLEGESRRYCEDCERIVWHNPVPGAGVAVVDRREGENAVCCVERAIPPGVGEWTLPGGYMDAAMEEGPAEAAARELEEETGLVVDPDALGIFDAITHPPREGKLVVSIQYVVDRAETSGEPSAGSDAADVRFLTPREFDRLGERFRPVHEKRFREIAAGE